MNRQPKQERNAGEYVPTPSLPKQWMLLLTAVLPPLIGAAILWWLVFRGGYMHR
jgi:hypothetical protein